MYRMPWKYQQASGLCPPGRQALSHRIHRSKEERRLFYVGMTRAREELILSTTTAPSMFLTDLPAQIIPETIARRERPAEQLSLF